MTTKLSSKGQVVLPRSIRHKLGLQPGESFAVTVEEGRIVLERAGKKSKARIVTDQITGFPVLCVDGPASKLTSEQVAEMLVNFP